MSVIARFRPSMIVRVAALLSPALVGCSAATSPAADNQQSANVAVPPSAASSSSSSSTPDPSHAPDCGVAPAPPPPPPKPAPPACTMPSLVSYATPAELEPILIGKWVRLCGDPEARGEVDGVEYAADHTFYPLRRAADGHLERVAVVTPDGGVQGTESWTAFVSSAGNLLIGDDYAGETPPPAPYHQFTYSAPQFSADGQQMALTYAPWTDLYARVAQ